MNFASSKEHGESTGLPSHTTSAFENQSQSSGNEATAPFFSSTVPLATEFRLTEEDQKSGQQASGRSPNVVKDSHFFGVPPQGPSAENLHLTESHKPNLDAHMSTQHQSGPSTQNTSHKNDSDYLNHSNTTSERRASHVANVASDATSEFSACGNLQQSTPGRASSFFTSPGDSRLIANTNEPSSVSDSYKCDFPIPTSSRSVQLSNAAFAQLHHPSSNSCIDKPYSKISSLHLKLLEGKTEDCSTISQSLANEGGFFTSPTSNLGYKPSPTTIGMLIKQESSPVTCSSPDTCFKSLSSSVQTYQSTPVGRSLSNESFESSQPRSESCPSNSTSTPTDVVTPSGSTKLLALSDNGNLDRTVTHLLGTGEEKRSLKNSPETAKPIIQTLKSMALSLDGNSDIASTPVSSIIAMMTTILQTIIDANDSLSSRLTNTLLDPQSLGSSNKFASNVVAFHSRNIPTIGLEAYLNRIQRYCPTTIDVFLSLLVYFDRIAQRVNQLHVDSSTPSKQLFIVDSYSIHRLLIAGVTVSAKFSSDVFYQNSRYAKVGGLPVEELNYLELQFLLLLDFQLLIDLDEHQRYMDLLVEFCKKEETESSPTVESAFT